jgi:hypothetical protein
MHIYHPEPAIERAIRLAREALAAVEALKGMGTEACPEDMLVLVRTVRATSKAAGEAMDIWGWPRDEWKLPDTKGQR